ncbi:hypothetical protein BJV77DRAFT_1068571 [Russula vinacea]|nr:hypothetical protein BJV77DRAFT_1068571 [Russula vinacea]
MSLLGWLPAELIIAIATLLDAPSLVCFESTCKTFQDLVNKTPALKYVLALAVRGLCDGPPSTVTAAHRLKLVDDYDEAWRTFSWSQYLVLDLPSFEAPYVSGNTLVIRETKEVIRSFIMQSIPSRLRGVPGWQWRVDFDFCVEIFVLDATQDLLVVVPSHNPNNVRFYQLSTGQTHPLSTSGGVHVEHSRRPSLGNSKQEVSGDFLGMITKSYKEYDDRLLIWNWKTGIVYMNMVCALPLPFPLPPPFVNTLGKQTLIRIAQPIRVSNYHEAVFSFLDDRHFVVPSISSKRPNEIVLDIFELHHPQHHGQQEQEQEQQQQQSEPTPIRSYVLSLADALTNVCSLRFFPDVSARCGASTGHFYADVSKRKLGIQIEAISKSTDTMTLHELLVPLRALMDWAEAHPFAVSTRKRGL